MDKGNGNNSELKHKNAPIRQKQTGQHNWSHYKTPRSTDAK